MTREQLDALHLLEESLTLRERAAAAREAGQRLVADALQARRIASEILDERKELFGKPE